jgi:RNA polymerase sigma-70 factor (ECF subfamily)
MSAGDGQTTKIQRCLDDLCDPSKDARQVREQLFGYVYDRLRRLAHRYLQGFPDARRLADTDDVCQDVAMRLNRALDTVRPGSTKECMGLIGAMIRRELIDLSRRARGKKGRAAFPEARLSPAEDSAGSPFGCEPADDTAGPSTRAYRQELHELVERLPPEEREVFDLHHYLGLTHQEIAESLEVSVPTVKRRWKDARLQLQQILHGEA